MTSSWAGLTLCSASAQGSALACSREPLEDPIHTHTHTALIHIHYMLSNKLSKLLLGKRSETLTNESQLRFWYIYIYIYNMAKFK